MDPALRTVATGMAAQQTRTEVIANNLANVNTTGFKRSRAHFEDLLYQTVQGATVVGAPDANSLPAIQVGRGTRLAGVERAHQQGPLEQTERPLDLAIEGEGFFQLQMPNGQVGYTRDGSFALSDTGRIWPSQVYTLIPGVKIPEYATDIAISSSAVVSCTRGSDKTSVEIGRIELARFMNHKGLLGQAQNGHTETPASGAAVVCYPSEDGMGRLLQGNLE